MGISFCIEAPHFQNLNPKAEIQYPATQVNTNWTEQKEKRKLLQHPPKALSTLATSDLNKLYQPRV